MTTATTDTVKHRILHVFSKLKNPIVVLNLVSVIILIFPIIPLTVWTVRIAIEMPASSDNGINIVGTLLYLGAPAGMTGLILAIFKKRNKITNALLIYGLVTYSLYLLLIYSELKYKDPFHFFYALYLSIVPIVTIIHIRLSIKSRWITWG